MNQPMSQFATGHEDPTKGCLPKIPVSPEVILERKDAQVFLSKMLAILSSREAPQEVRFLALSPDGGADANHLDADLVISRPSGAFRLTIQIRTDRHQEPQQDPRSFGDPPHVVAAAMRDYTPGGTYEVVNRTFSLDAISVPGMPGLMKIRLPHFEASRGIGGATEAATRIIGALYDISRTQFMDSKKGIPGLAESLANL